MLTEGCDWCHEKHVLTVWFVFVFQITSPDKNMVQSTAFFSTSLEITFLEWRWSSFWSSCFVIRLKHSRSIQNFISFVHYIVMMCIYHVCVRVAPVTGGFHSSSSWSEKETSAGQDWWHQQGATERDRSEVHHRDYADSIAAFTATTPVPVCVYWYIDVSLSLSVRLWIRWRECMNWILSLEIRPV